MPSSFPFSSRSLLVSVPLCIALFFMAFAIQRAYTFILTDKRAHLEFKFWRTRTEDAWFENVVNIVSDQDFAGRVFKYGTVRFVTAGTPYGGVKFWGVQGHSNVLSRAEEAKHAASSRS